MDFLILGPLEVRADGRSIDVVGDKQRALLATLLLHANAPVPLERVVEDLWGARAPGHAPYVVQVYAAQLADALGDPTGRRIDASARGVLLRADAGELDLLRFERLLASGRDALAGGDAERAAADLGAALDLFRGEPLAGLADAPFAAAARARLEDLRLLALEERVEASLARGRHREVVPELRGLVAAHPQRDRLRGQLMLALYRSGEREEALRAYELPVEAPPGEVALGRAAPLAELRGAIARDDAAAAPAAPEAAARVVLAVALEADGLDALAVTGRELCCARAGAELVLVRGLDAAAGDDLTAASRDVERRRAALVTGGAVARAAAFRSLDRARDVTRLASELEADLVLVDAPPALRETGRSGDELAAILAGAACDVAVLVGRLEASVQGPAAPVAALFGGGDHDWAALEIAAAVALARRAPLLLVGVATDDPGRDASRILASASLAIQRAFGVTAEPLLVPREPGRLLAATAGAALVAVGMPARWRHDDVGPHRLELLRNGAAPAVLVRRGLRPGLLAPREAATRFTWSLAPADAGAAAPASTHGERVLLTTLFTDIVASTERAAQLGDGPWRELLAAHRGVLLGELDRFGGRLVDTAGDGMFAVFDAPVRALRCAVAIRAAAREQGVEIRAGVHTGECERDGERVVGIAVHVGARVLGAAAPGEILATGTVRELVAGSGLRFEPRGEHALKGVPEPTRLFALALEAAA